MILPRLMIVTNRTLMQPDFETALQLTARGGARLFQWREKDLPLSGVLPKAQAAQKICEVHDAKLLVNSDLHLARRINAFGVHLPESQCVEKARQLLGREYSLGQSVHSLAAALQAEKKGADYLVVGSVFPTESHVGSTPIGVEELRKIAHHISIPIFAIGGISVSNARDCLKAGAHGVAVMRAIWNAPHIENATREILKKIES